MVKIAKFLKNSNWNMPETPSEMQMYDMVKIDTIVSCLKHPGSDRVKLVFHLQYADTMEFVRLLYMYIVV